MQFPEPQAPKPEEENILRFLVFRMASQDFMVEIHRVQEVLQLREITPVPAAPSFVEGVIELRGKVVTVVDLRTRLEMPSIEPGPRTRIIVFRSKRANFGLIVDSVARVLPIPLEEIQPPPEVPRRATGSTETLAPQQFILGVVKQDQSLYLILDPERILTTSELLTFPQLLPPRIES
jgi:Chemotaxis signal transduction protein